MTTLKPYIVSTRSDEVTKILTVTIGSANEVEAEAYARNYFGDYRADYRNRNVVQSAGTDTLGAETVYVFTVSRLGGR